MGASILITLREGLEISLVLAIIVGYLVKTGKSQYLRQVWIGVGAAVAVCVVAGVAFRALVGEFEGKSEQFIEGTLALSAVAVLTWMIFWMRNNARGMRGELHTRLDSALERSPMTIAVVAFIAVAREGFETVLFLIGAENEGTTGAQVVIGGVIGLAISAVLGVLIYRGGKKINLSKFFTWTGGLLLLFAAGLFAKGVHEFREFLGIEWSVVAKPLWTITSGPFAEGHTVYDFLNGLFGWSADPERIRVLAYFVYLIPIGWLYLRELAKPIAAATTPAAKQVARV
jgi:high-affinity iron transporter